MVDLVDDLTAEATGRCVELHPAAPAGTPCRADGRPVSEAVVDRLLSTPAVLAQEARLSDWAATAAHAGRHQPALDGTGSLDDEQAAAAAAVAGSASLVLVVGPAGTGKTRTLAAAVSDLRRQGRPVLGLAPSGKAADVLAAETGCSAVTLAKLLHDPDPRVAAGTTVLLDEAGMAATGDLDRLVTLVRHRGLRLVCVGDPDQLPAVGRGGMFAAWCDTLPAHRLEQVRRFSEAWQANASRGLRAGDPEAVAAYAAHGRLFSTHPALVAERVARQFEVLAARGPSVAVTTASTATARAVNLAIQDRSRRWHARTSARLADGTHAYPGDQVATRRNTTLVTDQGNLVRNRQQWTVTAVGTDGSLTVTEPGRGSVTLPADYVQRNVELGWAVTGYGNQGVTVDHAICVVEPASTRADVYVGMTRGRQHNTACIADPTSLADPAELLAAVLQRPGNAITAHATRQRLHDQHDLAVPDEPPPSVPLPEPERWAFRRSAPSLGL